jgi:hypothetical protein
LNIVFGALSGFHSVPTRIWTWSKRLAPSPNQSFLCGQEPVKRTAEVCWDIRHRANHHATPFSILIDRLGTLIS